MTDTQKKPLWKNELVWLFLLTSGLFAILYSKFILGGYAYVFTDRQEQIPCRSIMPSMDFFLL